MERTGEGSPPFTITLDLTMSREPRAYRHKHRQRLPRSTRTQRYFQTSLWPTVSQGFLIVTILKLATEERMAFGPARARFRSKRLRAVELYRSRFGEVPALKTYGKRQLSRLGQ